MPILIVEDDRNIAYLAQYHVRKLGHEEVTVVNNGGQAIALLGEQKFDLVLLDWMLPDISGIEIVRNLRSHSEHGKTPVIMMTARNRPEDVLAAVEAGANDYIVKPFERAVLQSKVVKLIGKQHNS
jgi:DNA-binding response OmpR family regulator